MRNARGTPAAELEDGLSKDLDNNASTALSARSSHSSRRAGSSSKPRLRELDTFKGKTLKEARNFIRSLELVFALALDAYRDTHARVLYSVMFLAGEPRKT